MYETRKFHFKPLALELDIFVGLHRTCCLWLLDRYQALDVDRCVGAIVCKLRVSQDSLIRGYIAMLAVDKTYRRRGIGELLVFVKFFSFDTQQTTVQQYNNCVNC